MDWLTEDTIEVNIKNEKIESEQQNLTQLVIHFVVWQNQGRKCQNMHAVARAASRSSCSCIRMQIITHIAALPITLLVAKALFSGSSNAVLYRQRN